MNNVICLLCRTGAHAHCGVTTEGGRDIMANLPLGEAWNRALFGAEGAELLESVVWFPRSGAPSSAQRSACASDFRG